MITITIIKIVITTPITHIIIPIIIVIIIVIIIIIIIVIIIIIMTITTAMSRSIRLNDNNIIIIMTKFIIFIPTHMTPITPTIHSRGSRKRKRGRGGRRRRGRVMIFPLRTAT
jgi:hypothetical protein